MEVYGDDLCPGTWVEDGARVGELGELLLGSEKGCLIWEFLIFFCRVDFVLYDSS